jgi:hypothetical protein
MAGASDARLSKSLVDDDGFVIGKAMRTRGEVSASTVLTGARAPEQRTRVAQAGRTVGKAPQDGRLTAEEKEAGLARMNRLRQNLASLPETDALPASKRAVPALVWDERLEKTAQEWADACPSGHRPNNAYGENMAWATRNDLVTSVNMWDAERANVDKAAVRRQGAAGFTFSTRQPDWCRGGWGACGHATQQLWADTRRVGCARSTTPCTLRGAKGANTVSLVVCNYDPPGNYQDKQVYAIS